MLKYLLSKNVTGCLQMMDKVDYILCLWHEIFCSPLEIAKPQGSGSFNFPAASIWHDVENTMF